MTEAERLIEEWQGAMAAVADYEPGTVGRTKRLRALDETERALLAYRPAPQPETRVEECHHTRWLNSIGSPSVCLECGATFDDKRGWIVPLRPRAAPHEFVEAGFINETIMLCRCGLRRDDPVHQPASDKEK